MSELLNDTQLEFLKAPCGAYPTTFHRLSLAIHEWITDQPNVGEETLTDWLLHRSSKLDSRIFYKTFTKHEESKNGADWEWWVLTNSPDGRGGMCRKTTAFRFLVQAKKLKPDEDNYKLLAYGNQNGAQIQLLLKAAEKIHAMPLYVLYSTTRPDFTERDKYPHYFESDICLNCINGCYLANARILEDKAFGFVRPTICDSDITGQSVPLSVLDLIISSLNRFENLRLIHKYYTDYIDTLFPGKCNISHMFMYNNDRFPDHLVNFINTRYSMDSQFIAPENLNGLGVIDLRFYKDDIY